MPESEVAPLEDSLSLSPSVLAGEVDVAENSHPTNLRSERQENESSDSDGSMVNASTEDNPSPNVEEEPHRSDQQQGRGKLDRRANDSSQSNSSRNDQRGRIGESALARGWQHPQPVHSYSYSYSFDHSSGERPSEHSSRPTQGFTGSLLSQNLTPRQSRRYESVTGESRDYSKTSSFVNQDEPSPNACSTATIVGLPQACAHWSERFFTKHAKITYGVTMVSCILFILFAQLTMSFSLEYEAGLAIGNSKTQGSGFNYNMWDGMFKLWQRGSYALVVVIAVCSGLWPYIKALALLGAIDKRFLCGINERRFTSVFFQLGKWSFIDVWVVIVAVLAVQVHRRISIFYLDLDATARQGIYLFFSATLILHLVTTVHYCAVASRDRNQRLADSGITSELHLIRKQLDTKFKTSELSTIPESNETFLTSFHHAPPTFPPATPVIDQSTAVIYSLSQPAVIDYSPNELKSQVAARIAEVPVDASQPHAAPAPEERSTRWTPASFGSTTTTVREASSTMGLMRTQGSSGYPWRFGGDSGRANGRYSKVDEKSERMFEKPLTPRSYTMALQSAILSLATPQEQEAGSQRTDPQSRSVEAPIECATPASLRSALHQELAKLTRSQINWVAFSTLALFSCAFFVALCIKCFQIHVTIYQSWEYDDTYSLIGSLQEIWRRHKQNAGLAFVFTMMVIVLPMLMNALILAFLALRVYLQYKVKDLLYAPRERQAPRRDQEKDDMTYTDEISKTTSPRSTGLDSNCASQQGESFDSSVVYYDSSLTAQEVVTILQIGAHWRALWWIREIVWTLAQWSCLEGFLLATFILGFELPMLLTESERALVHFSLTKLEGLFVLLAICIFQLFPMQRMLRSLCPDTSTLARILTLRDNMLKEAAKQGSLTTSRDRSSSLSSGSNSSSVAGAQSDITLPADIHAASTPIGPAARAFEPLEETVVEGVETVDTLALWEYPDGLAELNRFAAQQIGRQQQEAQIEAMQEAMRQLERERASRAKLRARADAAAHTAANLTGGSTSTNALLVSSALRDEVVLQMPPREHRLDYARREVGIAGSSNGLKS